MDFNKLGGRKISRDLIIGGWGGNKRWDRIFSLFMTQIKLIPYVLSKYFCSSIFVLFEASDLRKMCSRDMSCMSVIYMHMCTCHTCPCVVYFHKQQVIGYP